MSVSNQWNNFILRINVNATIESLYKVWATRSGMESWFLRESIYVRATGEEIDQGHCVKEGDGYTWRWYGYPDEVTETGHILEANGKDVFAFSFGKAGNCKVRFYTEKGEQMVELVQSDIPDDEQSRFLYHIGCKTGWTFYLANLKSVLEGGIDLRNRNIELQEMLNA
ncbi:MAG: SRPBCC domain-containing protein [Chitinophagaceae bacterium]|nr:SRPBCC domain-containing protein [Chitinophagaceae bacterium]